MQAAYENLVEEEDALLQKICQCEECKWTILDFCYKNNGNREVGEAILTSIHAIEQDYRTELLHLRLEKSLLAGKMRDE